MTDLDEIWQPAADLLDEITALRSRVAAEGRAQFARWRPRIRRPTFAAGALNLAHYLALREQDLRPLQRRLMVLGVSSLGRAEGRVMASLDAVATVLASLAGRPPPAVVLPSPGRRFFRGERRIAANADALFGPLAGRPRSRILVTLGPEAADDPAYLRDLVERGTDAVRINCAHDDADVWARMIANLRQAETGTGRKARILMDIAGPKVRTAEVVAPADRARLHAGDEFLLRRPDAPKGGKLAFQTGCTLPAVLDRLKAGDAVSIDDGKLRGRILRNVKRGFVVRVEQVSVRGLRLKDGKGLNFPGVDLGLDPLTPKDLDDLDVVAGQADMIGCSFVGTADHVARLQDELAARRADWTKLAAVLKIETPVAVRNLPEVLVQAAGRQPAAVMIARGDLAVELGFGRTAEMQEELLWLCEAAHVPAIWATQVLEGLVKKGVPSRGEMTDAAMAARAECVMLNKGPNVGAAVDALASLLHRMGAHQWKKTPLLRELHSWARA